MNINLGRLEKVSLRTVWEREAGHFTPWLALPDNLKLLGDTLGLELEAQTTEQPVGPFRADILCKTSLGQFVLIENQLERTDHSHLGQLLTYAAGLSTVTIIWVAEKFTDEHRAALDWLNEVTDKNINFFGLEIELWRIGESIPAPKFNIVSQPNDWTKTIVEVRRIAATESTAELQRSYWQSLREKLEQVNSTAKLAKPLAQNWMSCGVGRSNFSLNPSMNTVQKQISVWLVIAGEFHKQASDLLFKEHSFLETEIGESIRLSRSEKTSYIGLHRNANALDQSDWESQLIWFVKVLSAFHRYFSPRIKALDFSLLEKIEMENGL